MENQKSLTVKDSFIILWKAHLETKPSGRTYHGNRVALEKSFGGLPLVEVNEIHLSKHMEERLKGLNGFQKVGEQTVRHDCQLFTLLLNTLKRWKRKRLIYQGIHFEDIRLPEESPLKDLRRPIAKRREVLVTPHQFIKLIEKASDKMIERAWFSIDTGMNENDLRKLKVSDCDLETSTLHFIRSKNRHKVSTIHILPLSPRCRRIVQRKKEEGKDFILDWTNHINEWRKLRRGLALKFQWRDLRKTFGNMVYKRTHSIAKAQKALCHSSPRTTLDHYIIEDGKDLSKPISFISDVFA